eukprot:TRINITY_DN43230_c0_g1_i1.p1 TRINITY_DN43230_c0_g1~~TRINITY_DN43230_c0_g1_i1.p1  ORF type:complete len:417 (+),score=83.40 TRINITY_DN43230_c0_g1_i1:81-1253(+)
MLGSYGTKRRGEVQVRLPAAEADRSECLRDLKRTLSGGGVFVVSRGRRRPLSDLLSQRHGDVSREACEEAFSALAEALASELHALDSSGNSDSSCSQLALAVAAHISVAPGLQAVMSQQLPPALWQPVFAVCLSPGQVCVRTLAFVGEPVAGDRPSCKRTPFLLTLTTENLAAPEARQRADSPVRFDVTSATTGLETSEEHLLASEQELFLLANGISQAPQPFLPPRRTPAKSPAGRVREKLQWWEELMTQSSVQKNAAGGPVTRQSFGEKVANLRAVFGGAAPPAPSKSPAGAVVDRQARMRATLARAQSPAAVTKGDAAAQVSTPSRPSPAANADPQAMTPSRQVVDRAARMRANIRSQTALAASLPAEACPQHSWQAFTMQQTTVAA